MGVEAQEAMARIKTVVMQAAEMEDTEMLRTVMKRRLEEETREGDW